MKKIKAMLLALAAAGASLSISSISGSAENRLVITRDDSGNVTLVTSDGTDDLLEGMTQFSYITLYEAVSMGEHGEAYNMYAIPSSFVYFITDSNGFRREFMERPWIKNVDNWMSWDETTTDAVLESYQQRIGYWDSQDTEYKDGYDNWMSQYGSDAMLYHLRYRPFVSEAEQLTRETMLTQDGILGVVYLRSEIRETVYWNGEFSITPQSDYDWYYKDGEDYATAPDGLMDDLQEQKAIFEKWNIAYQYWMSSIDAASMTPAQLEASRMEAGVASDYEMIEKVLEACQTLQTKYSGFIKTIKPCYSARSFKEWIYPVSIWDTVGDLDFDGTLSAADAALLLEEAARRGAGDENEDSNSTILRARADINADYNTDAEDAALLLSYVAERGAGSDLSLAEFVRLSISEDH